MADGIRGVIPYPMPADVARSLATTPRIAFACPVCAESIAEVEVVPTSAGIELIVSAEQRELVDLHKSVQHPEHTSLQGVI